MAHPHFLLPLSLVFAWATLAPGQESVTYELRFPNAVHHEAEIRATFRGVTHPVLEAVMSRSSPGRYALHEFAKNVYQLNASDESGHALTVTRVDPSGWNVSGHHGTVVISYKLFGDRVDGTYAAIDETHAHLNGPAALIWARGFQDAPARVRVEVPAGSGWSVASQLHAEPDGSWSAPNLQRLMDAPLEISAHQMTEWSAGERHFRVALHHNGSREEGEAFAKLCEAVVVEEEGVFGGYPEYDDGAYTFLADYLPYASGDGMEHRNSTIISGALSLDIGMERALGTAAHEFFHSWNVKRIRPRSLQPFNFERANMSSELWFAEGFTNYYGILALRRAGLMNMNRFLEQMGGAVSAVLTQPGRTADTVIGMSQRAPFVDAATANDPVNVPNTFISYYTYGQAVALGLDLTLRSKYKGKSLDDWMRAMWHAHPDDSKPYTLDDLERALGEVSDPLFAREFFAQHIYSTSPLPYGDLLTAVGLHLGPATPVKVALGITTADFSPEVVLLTGPTLEGSPLYRAGLDRGDRIVAWEGKTITSQADLDDWLAKQKPGDRKRVKVAGRAGGQREVDLTLLRSPRLRIVPDEQRGMKVPEQALRLRSEWLASKAKRPLPRRERYCPVCRRSFAFEDEYCSFDGSRLHFTEPKHGEER